MEATHQILTVDTLSGPQEIKAPGGWKFDHTAKIVWHRMLSEVILLGITKGQRRRKADIVRHENCIKALAEVLASSLGMAAFYWEQAAYGYGEANHG